MDWAKRAVIMGFFLLAASQARAAGINGATCAPGDPAIQADRYFITAGSVNYKAGASGLVTVYCFAVIPICVDAPQHKLRLTYTDSDGAGNAVSVTAQLLRLSIANGSFLVAMDVRMPRGYDTNVLFGAEYDHAGIAQVQVGYRTGLDNEGINFGVGAHVANWRLGYAVQPFQDDLGSTHRFSVGFRL